MENKTTKLILVTGAAGFHSSHVQHSPLIRTTVEKKPQLEGIIKTITDHQSLSIDNSKHKDFTYYNYKQ